MCAGARGVEPSPPVAEARRLCGPRAGSAAVVSTVASEASRRAELHSGLCARPVSLPLWGGGGVFRDTERSALCAGATGRPAAPSRPQGCPPARLLSPAGALLPSCPPCAAAPPPRARAGHLRPACPPAGPHGGGGRIGAAAVGARQPRRRHSEIGAGRQGTRAPRLRAGSTPCQQGPRAGTRGLEAES